MPFGPPRHVSLMVGPLWAAALGLGWSVAASPPATAQTSPEIPEEAPESSPTESYWGPIGPPTEQTMVVQEAQGQPAWETAINLPYNLAFLPLKGAGYAVEHSVEFATENDVVQRVLHFFPYELGPTVIGAGVSIGSQDGYGGSLSMDVPNFLGEENPMKIRLSGMTEGNRKATLGVRYFRNPKSAVEVGAGYRAELESRFYGLSPESQKEDESQYRREVSWAGFSWRRELGGRLSIQSSALYSGAAATAAPENDDRPLTTVHSGLPFGYRDLSVGYTLGLELAHDNVELFGPPGAAWINRGRPEHGGLRRVSVSWFEGRSNTAAAFLAWRAEAQQFLPLWHTKRALALRGLVTRLEDRGGDPLPATSLNAALPDGARHAIPFQRLLTNDDPDLFRGYEDGRFHGRGLVAVTAEYRWPVWSANSLDGTGVDAYGFADLGQIFNEFSDIDSDHLTTSWGGGLRLAAYGTFQGRIEIGVSEESTQFRMRADQTFQFDGLGFFEGRNPVPGR